jgi:GDP-L-fucose synthase
VGKDISILDLARMVKQIVGFDGDIVTDTTKPDGTPRKLMDVSKLNVLGWKASINLEEGIKMVYEEIKNENW